MPGKSQQFIEQVEELHDQKPNRGRGKVDPILLQRQWFSADRAQYFFSQRDFAYKNWLELLSRAREFPKIEFQDDVGELRQEVDKLNLKVNSLSSSLDLAIKTINQLSKHNHEQTVAIQKSKVRCKQICEAYIDLVKQIEFVKMVYTTETNSSFICWTIVDAEPFNSDLLLPIYEAQVEIYKTLEDYLNLEFHVLNLSELKNTDELKNIMPSSTILEWQR